MALRYDISVGALVLSFVHENEVLVHVVIMLTLMGAGLSDCS